MGSGGSYKTLRWDTFASMSMGNFKAQTTSFAMMLSERMVKRLLVAPTTFTIAARKCVTLTPLEARSPRANIY